VLHQSGAVLQIEVHSSLTDYNGRPAVMGILVDITERKQAEEALHRTALQLNAVLSNAPITIFATDGHGVFTLSEGKGLELVGLKPSENVGVSALDLYGSIPFVESTGKVTTGNDVIRRVLAGEAVTALTELRGVYFENHIVPQQGTDGKVLGIIGVATDITDRKRAEEQLRKASAYARNLIEASLDPLVTISPDGKITDVNAATEAVTGRRRADLVGSDFSEYFTEPERARDGYRKVLAEREVRDYPLTIRHVSGHTTDVLYNASVYRDEAGHVEGVFAAARDVSERKQAEEALRESEAELREAQRVAHVGSWRWVVETDTVTWSEELFRIAGRDPAGPPPNYFREHATLYTSESLARLQPLVQRAIRTGEPYEVDLELIRPDGTTRWIADTGEARRDAKGQIVGLHGTVEDITDRRRLEAQFRQSQKMEAVGRLAGGVAHDFNNLLTVILGYSDILLQRLEPGPLHEAAQEVRRAGERAAGLTRQLLAFSRKQTLVPEVLDLGDVVSGLSTMVERLIGEDVKVSVVVSPGLGRVKADRGQLEQVVMNLAVNARDAMPKGGSLIFELQNVELDDAYTATHAELKPGPYVLLAISDSGTGMDAETQKHIFEPFFTTKEAGKGTGLGLSTVYGIVHQSGGAIDVYSEPGRGTTFKVYLPRFADDAAVPRAVPGIHPALAAASETVLVVEDEAAIRQLTNVILQKAGYTVLLAESPVAAERIAGSHPGPIHLLLTDVVMPGMRGPELAQRLLRLRPDLRVLYMSGYIDNAIARQGLLHAGAEFLQKPFTPDGLTRKVREVLDALPA
jgi:PAS domain S-box-containing protein